jgi:hypothetical protein
LKTILIREDNEDRIASFEHAGVIIGQSVKDYER